MKEIIIIKTENSQEIKKFLEQKHIDYEIYQKFHNEQFQKQLIADYQDASYDEEVNKELVD
jgi:nitrogen regulatory protein PII